jgi:glycerol-3-phosphate dehydrogenase
VVNATGVWADTLVDGVRLTPSKGAHLVLRAAALGSPAAGVTVPVPGERFRYVFAVPVADDRIVLGLTDDPVAPPVPDVPAADEHDRTFLLDTMSRALRVPLTMADVIGSYAGLRPLLAADSGSTSDLSRRHAVIDGPDGVVTVVGGKLTTYRKMAEDTVDVIAARRNVETRPCATTKLPLVGAASPTTLAQVRAPARLVRKYGVEAPLVLGMAGGDAELLEPIASTVPTTPAELLFGLAYEGALSSDDLLDRRSRIGLVPADRVLAEPVAAELTAHRGDRKRRRTTGAPRRRG